MTNEEWIRTMSHEDLIDFFDAFLDDIYPWYEDFDKKVCNVLCKHYPCIWSGECEFCNPIDWWLQQEHERKEH